MKQYFAKWLPVEGEVKEGEWGTYSSKALSFTGKLVERLSSEVGNRNAGHYLENGVKFLGIGHPNKLQKVQLFLCKKYAKVGEIGCLDNAKSIGQTTKIIREDYRGSEVLYIGENGNETYAEEAYSIIGRISPEATWVKEDDEFDEEEIHKGTYRTGFTTNWLVVDHHGEKNLEEEWRIVGEWKTCLLIKGPCGHFH